jgi:hypothetical protein
LRARRYEYNKWNFDRLQYFVKRFQKIGSTALKSRVGASFLLPPTGPSRAEVGARRDGNDECQITAVSEAPFDVVCGVELHAVCLHAVHADGTLRFRVSLQTLVRDTPEPVRRPLRNRHAVCVEQ